MEAREALRELVEASLLLGVWLRLLKNELRSGIHVSLDTARDGDVGGVGLTRGGVWRTELFEFSRTESKKWSALVCCCCCC